MTTHTINLTDERATLDPEWLRKVAAKPNAVILVAEPKLAMLADAIEIADESAWCLITSECRPNDDAGVRWWDSVSVHWDVNDAMAQAVRYLDARGLLLRHADDKNLLRLREAAE